MEKEEGDKKQYCSTNGGLACQKFTTGVRKEENEALFNRRRLDLLNREGDPAEEMKKEKEKFIYFQEYIRMVSSMNYGNSEISSDSDDRLSLNSPHIKFISKTLERYQGSYFKKEVLESQAHRAMNQYIMAYLHNRNNPDIEQACSAVFHIFSVCSQGRLANKQTIWTWP